jgi:replicative DNA helicase
MKQYISYILSHCPASEKDAIEKHLWEVLPKVFKDVALQKSALYRMLTGEEARWDNELEVAVLSRVLAYPSDALNLCASINADYFYEPMHAAIWLAISALYKGGKPVATDTVFAFLNERNIQIDVLYLEGLPKSAPDNSPYTWEEFPGLIASLADFFLLRQVCDACLEAIETSFKEVPDNASAIRANLINTLSRFSSGSISRVVSPDQLAQGLSASYAAKKAKKEAGQSVFGVPSGFQGIDRLFGGWQNSDFIVIAGRPAMGKTAMLLAIFYSAAKAGKPVLFFSLEMSKEQLVTRLFCMEKEVSYDLIRDTKLNPWQEQQLEDFCRDFENIPFYIEDTPSISAQYVSDVTAKYVQEVGITMVGIDYLQLMTSSSKKRNMNRTEEVGECSKGLKAAAKRFNIPIITLSQLSREVEKRADKIPMLSDLRESGDIEQDTDIVAFVFRPEYYQITEDDQGRSTAGMGYFIVAKNRNGALDTIPLFYNAKYAKFQEVWQKPEDYVSPNAPRQEYDFEGEEEPIFA